MNVNTTQLTLIRYDNTVEFILEDDKKHRSSVYANLDELNNALVYPYETINDLSQFMIFSPHGARVIRLNEYMSYCQSEKAHGSYTEYWYTFPFDMIKDGIAAIIGMEPSSEIDYTPYLEDWRVQFAPRISWQYGDGVEIAFFNDMNSPLVDWKHYDNKPDFRDHLARIASNYSDGNEVMVSLWFDNMGRKPEGFIPNDYYFTIVDVGTGNRVMNGGIIAHKMDDTHYQYSMHT